MPTVLFFFFFPGAGGAAAAEEINKWYWRTRGNVGPHNLRFRR